MIKKKTAACSGFSVIELLIVMAIMSAMAAISLPSMQRTLRVHRILGDTRGIAQTLTLARMRAAANFTIEPPIALVGTQKRTGQSSIVNIE